MADDPTISELVERVCRVHRDTAEILAEHHRLHLELVRLFERSRDLHYRAPVSQRQAAARDSARIDRASPPGRAVARGMTHYEPAWLRPLPLTSSEFNSFKSTGLSKCASIPNSAE